MEMTSTDFAKAIRVSLTTVYNLERKGIVLPVRKSPFGRRFYTDAQVDAYLAGDYSNPVLKGCKPANGVSHIPTRHVSHEEAMKDIYIFDGLRKLGYDINECDGETAGYDESKYLEYVSIAAECLYEDREIPKEVVDYMLKVKEIRENKSSCGVPNFANSLFYVDPSWKMDEERAEMIRQFDEHMKEVNTHPENLNFDTEEGMKHDRPHVEVTEEEIRAFEEAGEGLV